MPIGLNDLIALGGFTWRVYHTASSEYTCANQEYHDFVNDIETLARALDALRTAATEPSISGHQLALSTDFVQAVISESKKTIEACEHLIRRNPYFRRNQGPSAVTNIVWAVSVKEDVGKLQTRVHLCFHKTNFILLRQGENNQQAALELLGANQQHSLDAIQILLRQLADHAGLSPDLAPDELLGEQIRQRFFEVQQWRSTSTTTTNSISSKLDSMLVFYERSTHAFNSQLPIMTVPPTVQYVNLLKCLYLLEDIRNDTEFRTFGQKPMSNAWFRFNANKVHDEAMRFVSSQNGIERVPDDEILRLGRDEFVLDLNYLEEDSSVDSLAINAGEELISQQTLFSSDSTSIEQLSIFRINDNTLHLARTVTRATQCNNATPRIRDQELHTQIAVLEPIYAMAPQAQPSIVWRPSSRSALRHDLHFASINHVRDFQRAVTNHVVVLDDTTLVSGRKKCSFYGAGTVFADKGRIQLWSFVDPTHPEMYTKRRQSRRDSVLMQSSSSSQSPSISQSEFTFTQRSIDGFTQSTVLRGGRHGNELVPPMPYQLIFMTVLNNKHQLVSICIDEDTNINPDKCSCSKANSTCREIYIEHSKRKGLKLTTVVDDNGWNLAVFGKVDHHRHHEDLSRAREENVKHVVLKFVDVPARERCARILHRACVRMREKYNDYITAANKIQNLGTYTT